MEYGVIEQELQHLPEAERTHRDVSEAVIRIRQSKLPDPAQIGNAGSFFKNPTIPAEQAKALLATHPNMPNYPQPSGEVKLAAGWLIEQAGWKGHNRTTHGVHDRQALVLVHFGARPEKGVGLGPGRHGVGEGPVWGVLGARGQPGGIAGLTLQYSTQGW